MAVLMMAGILKLVKREGVNDGVKSEDEDSVEDILLLLQPLHTSPLTRLMSRRD
jgi:hypothetical protein